MKIDEPKTPYEYNKDEEEDDEEGELDKLLKMISYNFSILVKLGFLGKYWLPWSHVKSALRISLITLSHS